MKLEFLLKDKYDEGRTAGEAEGISIGEAKGISIGEANERNRMVKAMYADGVSVDKISQYAAIPVEEVKAILKT